MALRVTLNSTFSIQHSTFNIPGAGSMNRLHWALRDLIRLILFVALLIAVNYFLEWIPINGIAYYRRIIVFIGINIGLAVSLNIINGHAGQFSLGHAGFMAIGAYTSAFLTFYYFSPYVDKLSGTNAFVMQNALLIVALHHECV